MRDYQSDQSAANDLYQRHLLPALADDLCAGITLASGDTGEQLDRLADIDAIASNAAGTWGIGWRIQVGSWDTFTIRLSRNSGTLTQFEKISRAIRNGNLYPKLTCHAYLDGEMLRYAVAQTRELWAWIETHRNTPLVEVRRTSNAAFLVVRFDDVEGHDWCVVRERNIAADTHLAREHRSTNSVNALASVRRLLEAADCGTEGGK